MIADWFFIAALLAALTCGLMAGIFFAFSSFVMAALARLPPATGIAAMQAINTTAVTPMFMFLFFGAAATCLAVLVGALSRWSEPGAGYALLGSVFYLVGTFLITVVANVPRNNALATVEPTSSDGLRTWATFLPSWTRWNHVRTVAATCAAALLIIALVQIRSSTP